MTDPEAAPERSDPEAPDRESPVGEPVVRGDSEVLGERASEALRLDPEDPESVDLAADLVGVFGANPDADTDSLYLLRGAAACAVLVRALGSYTAAAERAGADVTVSFVRKWARVHDLPRPIRIQVATGELAPSAAKHIARLQGTDRCSLAWAAVDHDLTVREVRRIVSERAAGDALEAVLARHGIDLGRLEVDLDPEVYRRLRRAAATEGEEPERLVEAAVRDYL